MERWAKPVIPKTVEYENGAAIALDGVVRQDVRLVLNPEDVDRIRLGYVCLKCLEPHPEPFPRKCFLCGYAMKDRQSADFSQDYGGEQLLGPAESNDEIVARMKEERAREQYQKGSSIWVPGTAKLQ